jgi:conjugative transfer region protein TrbK
MKMTRLKRLPTVTAIVLLVLAVAACAFPLHGDQDQANSSVSADRDTDPLAAKLAECRSITSEQNDALAECQKAWAGKRRQFLGQRAPSASSDSGPPQAGSSLFVPPKDQSRLSPGYPSIQQPEKE